MNDNPFEKLGLSTDASDSDIMIACNELRKTKDPAYVNQYWNPLKHKATKKLFQDAVDNKRDLKQTWARYRAIRNARIDKANICDVENDEVSNGGRGKKTKTVTPGNQDTPVQNIFDYNHRQNCAGNVKISMEKKNNAYGGKTNSKITLANNEGKSAQINQTVVLHHSHKIIDQEKSSDETSLNIRLSRNQETRESSSRHMQNEDEYSLKSKKLDNTKKREKCPDVEFLFTRSKDEETIVQLTNQLINEREKRQIDSSTFESKNKHSQETINNLISEKSKLEQQLKKTNFTCTRILNENRELKAENGKFKQNYATLQETQRKREESTGNKISRLNSEVAHIKVEKKQLEENISSFQQKLKMLEEEKSEITASLQTQLSEKNNFLTRKTKEFDKLLKEKYGIDNLIIKIQETSKKVEIENNILKNEKSKLKRKISLLQTSLETEKEKNVTYVESKLNAEMEIKQKDADFLAKNEELKTAQSEISSLRQHCEKKDVHLTKQSKELQSLQKSGEVKASKIKTMEEEMNGMKDKENKNKKEIEECITYLENLNKERTQELFQQSSCINQLKEIQNFSKSDSFQQRIAKQIELIIQNYAGLSDLQNRIRFLTTEMKKEKAHFTEANNLKEKILIEKNVEMSAKNEELQTAYLEISSLQTELSSLRLKDEQKDDTISILTQQLNNLEIKNHILSTTLLERQGKQGKKDSVISSQNEEMEKLRTEVGDKSQEFFLIRLENDKLNCTNAEQKSTILRNEKEKKCFREEISSMKKQLQDNENCIEKFEENLQKENEDKALEKQIPLIENQQLNNIEDFITIPSNEQKESMASQEIQQMPTDITQFGFNLIGKERSLEKTVTINLSLQTSPSENHVEYHEKNQIFNREESLTPLKDMPKSTESHNVPCFETPSHSSFISTPSVTKPNQNQAKKRKSKTTRDRINGTKKQKVLNHRIIIQDTDSTVPGNKGEVIVGKYPCRFCDSTFLFQSGQSRHETYKHPVKAGKRKRGDVVEDEDMEVIVRCVCEICNKDFARQDILRLHKQSIHNLKMPKTVSSALKRLMPAEKVAGKKKET